MSKKQKRKARNKMAKENLDLLKPINILEFGSSDDPCFGKLYDPKHPTCSRCGDSEFCSIMMNQNNATKRTKLEKKGKFKDLEEDKIPKGDKKALKKEIKVKIKGLIKESDDGGISQDSLVNAIFAQYSKDGFTQKAILSILSRLKEKNSHIKFKNNKYLWK